MQELDLPAFYLFIIIELQELFKAARSLRAARIKKAARVVRVLFGLFWQERPAAHNSHAKTAHPLLHGETGPDNAA